MRQHLFVCIMNIVEEHDDYFIQKRNAAGMLGLCCLYKVAMIAYGIPAGATDDYLRVGQSTGLKCPRRFVVAYIH
jgi:hypothetical protein